MVTPSSQELGPPANPERFTSLVSYDMTAGLLKDVLPIEARTNAATIRNHLHKVALRQELGDGQLCLA
jgi:hypothetical protein